MTTVAASPTASGTAALIFFIRLDGSWPHAGEARTWHCVEPDPDTRQRHTRRNVAIFGGVIVALLVAGAVTVGVALASIDVGDIGRRSPTKAIPIPATACPYLRVVSVAASDANHWDQGIATGDVKSWRAFAKRTAPTLAALDHSLRLAIPHVPKPVATQLRWTLLNVVKGRPALLGSESYIDYLHQSEDAVTGGYAALSEASDLVGNACGFTLAPLPRL